MGLNYYTIKKNILRARKLVIRGTNLAGSGHPGGSFSMAEILGCLFNKHLKFDPNNPEWEDRDRLVIVKGACCTWSVLKHGSRWIFPGI